MILLGIISIAISIIFVFPTFTVRTIVRTIGKLFFKVKIEGNNNIPKSGGALLVANHVSYLDFIITTLSINRPVRFVMYKDIFEKRFLRILLKKLKMIPISPRGGQNDLNEFNQKCRSLIEQGELVIIFSEGTVSRNGQILEFKRGIEHIAKDMSAPIIPIYFGGLSQSPFTFDIQNQQFWKFNIKNLRKRVFTLIGQPLPSETTANEVRQHIIDLEANSFQNRIENNTLITAIFQKNYTSFSINQNRKELKKNAILKAHQLKPIVKDYLEIGIHISNNKDVLETVLALNLLGKTPVLLDTSKSRLQNIQICRKLNLYTTICDTPNVVLTHENIQLSSLSSNSTFKTKLLNHLPHKSLLKAFNNTSNKWNNAVILTADGIEKLSHQQVIALSMSLSKIGQIKKFGTFTSVSPINSSLGYLTKVILPLVATTEVKNKLYPDTTTLIGKTNEIEAIKPKLKTSKLKYVITDEFGDQLKVNLPADCLLLKGSGIKGLLPILSLNTPDYEGKDIAGKSLSQQSNNPFSAGRILPGIAYRIIDPISTSPIFEPNVIGKLFIKGAHSTYNSVKGAVQWIDTGLYGKIDQQGFLQLV